MSALRCSQIKLSPSESEPEEKGDWLVLEQTHKTSMVFSDGPSGTQAGCGRDLIPDRRYPPLDLASSTRGQHGKGHHCVTLSHSTGCPVVCDLCDGPEPPERWERSFLGKGFLERCSHHSLGEDAQSSSLLLSRN